MKSTKCVAVFFAAFLVATTVSIARSGDVLRRETDFVTGKITSIQGNQITIQDSANKLMTFVPPGLQAADKTHARLLDFKIGDQVKGQLNGGKLVTLERVR